MNTISTWNDTVIQVKVPLPFPLRWVNSYLIKGGEGITVIDPGLHTLDSEQVWEQALEANGLTYRDISQVVLTHHHPDHYGLAGWFQERSGAPVLMSSDGLKQAVRLWGDGTAMTPELLELFARHGMPEAMTEPMREHMDSFEPLVSPQPKVSELEPGDSVTMGGRAYRTIHTPGHAYGHLILYDEAAKAVFCGDHVLPQITPNVSFLPGADANPLASFLHSLEAVADLPVAIAYPGHRDPFERFGERAREIVAHHHLRLEKMKGMMGDSPHTAYEVCGMLFGDRLSLHQLRFAIAETIAHLVYMRESGAAEELEGPGLAGTVAYRVV